MLSSILENIECQKLNDPESGVVVAERTKNETDYNCCIRTKELLMNFQKWKMFSIQLSLMEILIQIKTL